MARSGVHADSDGQLAGDLSDATRRLKALEQRKTRIDQALGGPADKQLAKLAGELKEARRTLVRLENGLKELHAREDERSRQQEALQSGLQGAAVKTAAVQQEIEVIERILASGLPSRSPAFSDLKHATQFPAFDPATLAAAEPVPQLEPEPLRPRISLPGGKSRYERQKAEVQERNDAALTDYSRRHARWQQDLDQARSQYDSHIAALKTAAEQHNAAVDHKAAGFAAGDPDAISWFVCQALAYSQYPDWYPPQDRQCNALCRADRHDILIELELPPAGAVPAVRGYQYVPGQAEILALPRPQCEVSQQYRQLIAAIALRTISETLAATAAHADAVRTVILNGRARGIDAATGHPAHPYLLSVSASREAFSHLELTQVRPETCLKYLGARISPDPLSLQPAELLEAFPPD